MEDSDDENSNNIWIAASDGDLLQVKQFIQNGVDINSQDDAGYSPLHAAVSYGHGELIKYLLDNGANVKLPDQDGDLPIHCCETIPAFDLLVEAGADPMAVNFSGESLHQKLMEEHNDELLTYFMNYLVKKGLGGDIGVTFTAHSEADEANREVEDDNTET
jgi:ankyrin repeat protein